ncbi:DUF4397 domain-containing protein [Umezawaea endophytica]|uniref:DUF4397 domain-containing protein n=1 Tax=Umezawaea endophytica TaxID=1654476 RepID=A0A9X2VGB4_9PSEU|nr:DUF4397 domain-containing protein [Umezawaea endophytica]MCS7476091.1 DUF4397 domain-containing protein [Umezawaea endophytica]
MRAVRACAVLLLLLVLTPPAHAATGTYIRLAHLSPGTGSQDITLIPAAGTAVRTTGVDYGDLLDYRRVEPGPYTVEWRPLGSDPGGKATASTTVNAAQGKAYTVAGLGNADRLALKVLDDDITLPGSGQARIRMVNAAPRAASADLVREGTAILRQAVYAEPTLYTSIAPETATLQVVPRGAEPASLTATIEPGGVYTVVVLELDGKVTATIRADAKASEVVPGGGQETGWGGMADGEGSTEWPVVPFAAVLVCAAVLWARRDRVAP